uniref:Lipopolysaccharide export system protein LptA n=1 Tax=Candidatus Kentrum sp. MB TaxID=2138164 RepID=A0A450WZU4_9GAMM|nr:MAG: lipopolysaccharide export system protein LptA [Candidatus Kentron sp. MB]
MIHFLSRITICDAKIRNSPAHHNTEWMGKGSLLSVVRRAVIICLAWLGPISFANGLSTDREQPIYVEADSAEADEAHKTVTYKGTVIVTQGSMRINGETVTLYYDENRTLTKAKVKGRPARFQQRPDGSKEKQHAKANRMEYFANRDLIILLGNAHSWQGKRRISADRIEFDTKKSRVRAHGKRTAKSKDSRTDKSSRVRIVVPIKQK